MQSILGDWQVNGILSLRTGVSRIHWMLAAASWSGAEAHCGPELYPVARTQRPPGGRTPSEWFNTANFGPPAPLSQGNVGLQTNYGPPTKTLDFSIFKNFAITERFALQFRAESTNLFNTAQFNTPDLIARCELRPDHELRRPAANGIYSFR